MMKQHICESYTCFGYLTIALAQHRENVEDSSMPGVVPNTQPRPDGANDTGALMGQQH